MALLILWEVDHDQSFPTQGGGGLSAALLGFTRRLQQRAAQDPRLDCLESEDSALPLAPGLMPTHHRRWSVRVAAPAAGEPRGWYDTFVERWRAYLEAFVCPPGSRPMSRVSPAQLARVRPGVVPTNTTVAIAGADEASSSTAVTGTAGIPAASGAAPSLPARSPPATRERPRPAGEAQPRRRRPTATVAAPPAATPQCWRAAPGPGGTVDNRTICTQAADPAGLGTASSGRRRSPCSASSPTPWVRSGGTPNLAPVDGGAGHVGCLARSPTFAPW
jgi:hypothetical protein